MKRDHRIAIWVGAAWFGLSVAFRSRQHSYDALMFTYALADGGFHPSIWRPHNLFFLPGALGLHRLFGSIWCDPFLSGQIWAALWAGVAMGLGWLLFRRFLRIREAALLLCLFGTSHAMLAMSTLVEVYTASLAAVSALVLVLWRRTPDWRIAGLLWGLSVLCHLTNVLLGIPLLLYCLSRRELQSFGTLSLWGGVPTLAVYLLVGFGLVGVEGAGGFVRWVISYASNTEEFGQWGLATVRDGLLGSKRALVEGRALGLMIFHVAAMGFALRAIGTGRKGSRAVPPLVVFLVVYTVFFCWWEPLNVEFRLVPLLPFWLLVGFALRQGAGRLLLAVLGCALLVQVWFNGAGLVRRLDRNGDYWTQSALRLGPQVEPGDLVLGFNDPTIFALRIVNNHRNIASIDMAAGAEQPNLENARRALLPWIGATRSTGGRLLLLPEALQPGDARIGRLGITRAEYDSFLDELRPWIVLEP